MLDDMVHDDGRKRLRFDFYLPDRQTLIEYDGHQHFEPVTFGGMTDEEAQAAYKRTVENDFAKNHWAAENGYTLIRIRYDEEVGQKLSEALL